MESRFQVDFSRVRIHHDAEAARFILPYRTVNTLSCCDWSASRGTGSLCDADVTVLNGPSVSRTDAVSGAGSGGLWVMASTRPN